MDLSKMSVEQLVEDAKYSACEGLLRDSDKFIDELARRLAAAKAQLAVAREGLGEIAEAWNDSLARKKARDTLAKLDQVEAKP